MNARAMRNSAKIILSVDDAVAVFFASAGLAPNENIWRALLTLLMRQSAGYPACVADLFPQPWLSHRTRVLYARQMQSKGLIAATAEKIEPDTEFSLPVSKTIEIAAILRCLHDLEAA
jgi:hypothetical protein